MPTRELTNEQVISKFNEWDESAAYEAERQTLTHAQLCGDALCTFYELDSPFGFMWAQTTAAKILELVTRLPWRRVHIDVLREEGVEMSEILQGIEFIRAMKEDASNWVQIILNAVSSDCNPMEIGASSADAIEWLNEATWKMPELMRRRLESPFFFGKICLELARQLNEAPSVQED